jgi:hypothetical protein
MDSDTQTLDLFGQSSRAAAIDALHAATAIYTCEPIVEQLLDHIHWPVGARTLVDTSCGDGAFLGRALDRLLAQEPCLSDDELSTRITGWEIHFFAADQARERLRQVLLSHGRNPASAESVSAAMIHCADFLTEGPRERKYHAIVGNPPYLRFVNVPGPLRREYSEILPDYAKADLLHSFLDRCASLLHPDGQLAMVTADRWLFNAGAARLREVVGRRFGLAHVERLDAASTFYRPKQRRAGTPPRIHPVAVVLTSSDRARVPIGRDPIFPGEVPYVSPSFTLTLGQVATVRLAPWLGTPGVFLIDEACAMQLPREHLVRAIDTDDIRDGHLIDAPRRRAILTRPDQCPHPKVMAHLAREMPRMCARGRRRSPWLPPESFHDFDLSSESLLVPRIARTLRPVRVPSGVLPVNHNLSITCSGNLTLDDISAVLDRPEATEWVQHHAAPLENGYRSLTARLLRSLPVFE